MAVYTNPWICTHTYTLPFPAIHLNLISRPPGHDGDPLRGMWRRDNEFFQGTSEKAQGRKIVGGFAKQGGTQCTEVPRSEQERSRGKSGLFSAAGA